METKLNLNTEKPVKIFPLGGLGEIGMNAMLIEQPNLAGENDLMLIDCGLMFSDLENFGVDFIIPDFTDLFHRRHELRGIVLTHGHEDHIGALPYLLQMGISAPIYCSPFTRLMVSRRLEEMGLDGIADVREFKPGTGFTLGSFKIETESVNHSIVDAVALCIQTLQGRVIHTGDFKIDPMPFYGSKLNLDRFKAWGEAGVAVLMSDSTNVERHQHTISESRIYERFEELCAAAEGMVVISMFASNIGRIGQIFSMAEKMGKKVAVAGRSMEQNILLAQQSGYLKNAPNVLVSLDEIDFIARHKLIVLSTGSQGEYRSSLIRIANGEHKQIKLQPDDLVLMSSKFIPGNEVAIGRMINSLFKQGCEVLYGAMNEIHTSGHATRPELIEMIKACKPKFFVPIHGEYRHLVHHARLAEEMGLKPENVCLAVNGDLMELSPNALEISKSIEMEKILIENRQGRELSRLLLKERRQLAEAGVVFGLYTQSIDSGRFFGEPQILLRGAVSSELEGQAIDVSREALIRVANRYHENLDSSGPAFDPKEEMRLEMRRALNLLMDKKIPVMIEFVLV